MDFWKRGRVEVTARESRKDGGGGEKNGRRAGRRWKYGQRNGARKRQEK